MLCGCKTAISERLNALDKIVRRNRSTRNAHVADILLQEVKRLKKENKKRKPDCSLLVGGLDYIRSEFEKMK